MALLARRCDSLTSFWSSLALPISPPYRCLTTRCYLPIEELSLQPIPKADARDAAMDGGVPSGWLSPMPIGLPSPHSLSLLTIGLCPLLSRPPALVPSALLTHRPCCLLLDCGAKQGAKETHHHAAQSPHQHHLHGPPLLLSRLRLAGDSFVPVKGKGSSSAIMQPGSAAGGGRSWTSQQQQSPAAGVSAPLSDRLSADRHQIRHQPSAASQAHSEGQSGGVAMSGATEGSLSGSGGGRQYLSSPPPVNSRQNSPSYLNSAIAGSSKSGSSPGDFHQSATTAAAAASSSGHQGPIDSPISLSSHWPGAIGSSAAASNSSEDFFFQRDPLLLPRRNHTIGAGPTTSNRRRLDSHFQFPSQGPTSPGQNSLSAITGGQDVDDDDWESMIQSRDRLVPDVVSSLETSDEVPMCAHSLDRMITKRQWPGHRAKEGEQQLLLLGTPIRPSTPHITAFLRSLAQHKQRRPTTPVHTHRLPLRMLETSQDISAAGVLMSAVWSRGHLHLPPYRPIPDSPILMPV